MLGTWLHVSTKTLVAKNDAAGRPVISSLQVRRPIFGKGKGWQINGLVYFVTMMYTEATTTFTKFGGFLDKAERVQIFSGFWVGAHHAWVVWMHLQKYIIPPSASYGIFFGCPIDNKGFLPSMRCGWQNQKNIFVLGVSMANATTLAKFMFDCLFSTWPACQYKLKACSKNLSHYISFLPNHEFGTWIFGL